MEISVRANAKLNLALDTLGLLENGYHSIDSVFQSVSLCDEINIIAAEGTGVTVVSSIPSLNGDNNIADRAVKMYLKKAGIRQSVYVKINKSIPIASGLGGGSSNAAATLLALNRMYDNRLTMHQLHRIALQLGSDVPFCLEGGTMRARGIGDELTPLPVMPDCCFVLMKNAVKRSTGEMYGLLDSRTQLDHPDINAVERAVVRGDYSTLCKNVKNIFSCLWDYSDLKSLLAGTGADAVSLTGSGPVVFAMYSTRDTAQQALDILKKANVESYLCTPVKKSCIFE